MVLAGGEETGQVGTGFRGRGDQTGWYMRHGSKGEKERIRKGSRGSIQKRFRGSHMVGKGVGTCLEAGFA
jgi:hypothetical protein